MLSEGRIPTNWAALFGNLAYHYKWGPDQILGLTLDELLWWHDRLRENFDD